MKLENDPKNYPGQSVFRWQQTYAIFLVSSLRVTGFGLFVHIVFSMMYSVSQNPYKIELYAASHEDEDSLRFIQKKGLRQRFVLAMKDSALDSGVIVCDKNVGRERNVGTENSLSEYLRDRPWRPSPPQRGTETFPLAGAERKSGPTVLEVNSRDCFDLAASGAHTLGTCYDSLTYFHGNEVVKLRSKLLGVFQRFNLVVSCCRIRSLLQAGTYLRPHYGQMAKT